MYSFVPSTRERLVVWVERLRTLSLSTAEWEVGQSHGAS